MPAVALSPGGGRAWRAVRHHGDPRRARSARRPAQPHPGAGIGARHEPGDGGGLRLHRRGDPGERARPGRSRRAEGEARPRCRGADADQPEHLRAVRARDPRDRRGGARGRRLLLLRRRQFQRHRRAGAAGRSRHRRACTSTCTRPSRRRMAAAGPGSGPVVLAARAGALRAVAVDRARAGRASRWSSMPKATRRRSDRPAEGLSRPDGHVRARARLHDEPRLGRAASGRRGRGAQRQLPAGQARRMC